LTLAVALAAAFALAWFRYMPIPFLGPLVLLGAVCVYGVRFARNDLQVSLLLTVAALTVTLGVAEARWSLRGSGGGPAPVSYPDGYLLTDSLLGYRAAAGAHVRARRVRQDSILLYDVTYDTDSSGLRVAPPAASNPGGECVLFFGGSFTFGEGVENQQTMPYRVGVLSGGRYRTVNFGLHGYGPHHMLALLQSGRVAHSVGCRPRYAIHLAIGDHVARAAGLSGGPGPRYSLHGGAITREPTTFGAGPPAPTLVEYVLSQFSKSALVRAVQSRLRESHWELYFSVVVESARLVERAFPGSELHVIAWTFEEGGRLGEGLRARGLRVHDIRTVLPRIAEDPFSHIIPGDLHPTAASHDQMARYVVSEILGLEITEPAGRDW
jgi:hypothetical protein